MSGPKISIGIDDSVTAKVEELNAKLRQAKKEVRELEKEADKALKQTGKLGDDLIKKIDDAKKRAGGLNAQIRGMRGGAPLPGRIGRDDTTAGGAMDGLRDMLDNAGVFRRGLRGGGFLNTARGIGGNSTRSLAGRAGLIGAAIFAVGKGGLNTYDRDLDGQKIDQDIRLAKMFGQDTELAEMERDRKKLTSGGLFKFTRGVLDIVPGGSRMFSTAEEAYATAKGFGKADFAAAVFNKTTEGMSANRRRRLYETAKQELDGNALSTGFTDWALHFLPAGPLRNFAAGEREQKISARVQENLRRADELEKKGYALVDTNNFSGAKEAFNMSAAAGASKAISAVEAWKQQDNLTIKMIREKAERKVPSYRMGM